MAGVCRDRSIREEGSSKRDTRVDGDALSYAGD